jgi:hypothetical protein
VRGRNRSPLDQHAEVLALEHLGDQVEHATIGADVMQRHDIGVVERPRGARLRLEALLAPRISGHRARQDLHRNVPSEARIAGAIDLMSADRVERGGAGPAGFPGDQVMA